MRRSEQATRSQNDRSSRAVKDASWSPDGTESGKGPSSRRVIIIVSVILAAWVGFSYWAMEYGDDAESMLLDDARGPVNTVEVTNDVAPIVYFVPCADERCEETPKGNHRADFNQLTQGHAQEIQVTRTKETTVTYGVFDETSRVIGCIDIVTTKSKLDVVRKSLSEIMTSCVADDTRSVT